MRSVGRDDGGADLCRRDALARGLWYADDEDPGERDEELADWFAGVCVDAARRLHRSGRIVGALGRAVPVVLYDMFDPDAMFALTARANPAALVAEFTAADVS
ncbi:hypothetical protein ABZ930_04685 [Streptomyces sp. NPDC046716]|uniref:hypothetical protein n=1 Tax=Streptomyces sp. NPDC046716 TaxID=3157093 RepID=UPI0033EF403B